MSKISYKKILKKNWEVLVIIVGLIMIVGLSLTLIQGFEYQAKTRFLIVQQQDETVNAYEANKSAVKIAEVLSLAVKTTSFYSMVEESQPQVKEILPDNSKKLKEFWEESVIAGYDQNLPVLTIKVFHEEKSQAQTLAMAINQTLIENYANYHGGGNKIFLNQIDSVQVSDYPVKPNMIVNALASLVLGVIVGFSLLVMQEEFQWFRSKPEKVISRLQKEKPSEEESKPAFQETGNFLPDRKDDLLENDSAEAYQPDFSFAEAEDNEDEII